MNLAFTGDISFTGIFENKLQQNEEIFSKELIELLHKQDFVIGNFEGAATKHTISIKKPALKNPIEAVDYLLHRNIKIFNLANNHLFDFGFKGFEDTIILAKEKGIKTVGAAENIQNASEPLIIEKEGIKVAIFACAHNEGLMATRNSAGVFSIENVTVLKQKIQEAKKNADHIILMYHGGEEFTLFPMPQRRKMLQKMAKFGVGAIVCHHTHVVQGYEVINNIPVFYSLGNFIFDYKEHVKMDYTQISTLLCFNFNKNNFDFNMKPLNISTEKGIISFAEESINQHFNKLNNFTNYRSKWNEEAYRVWNQKKQIPHEINKNKAKNTTKKNIIIRTIKFLNNLRYTTYRSVIMGAIAHYLKKKFL